MQARKISVVIPVYRVEHYLRECVDSVLAQTFREFDLVLVDDGSPDACGVICDEYAKKDPRVHVIHQKNGGLSAARNAGIDWTIQQSSAQWIFFIDGDDAIKNKALEELYRAATEHQVQIAVGAFEVSERFDGISRQANSFCKITPYDFWKNTGVNRVVAWGKLFAVDLFRNIRFPVGKIHEDELTTPWLLFQAEKIVKTNAPLYFYRSRAQSITTSKWTMAHLSTCEAERKKRDYFKQLGFVDLAAEADLRLLANLGKAVMEVRALKGTSTYSQNYSVLKDELLSELKRVKLEQPVRWSRNYHCMKALHPWLCNVVSWKILRGVTLVWDMILR